MNKGRRLKLNAVLDDIKRLKKCSSSEEAATQADLIKDSVEMVRDEEELAYNSLPGGLQNTSRGDDMQDNIYDLEEAMDELDNFISDIEDQGYVPERLGKYLTNAINKITDVVER